MNAISLDELVRDYLETKLSGGLNYFAFDGQIGISTKYKN
jgi:hypothetical protein